MYHKIEIPATVEQVFNFIYILVTIRINWCIWGFSHSALLKQFFSDLGRLALSQSIYNLYEFLGINMSLVMTEVNLLLTYGTEKHYCNKELLTPESMESILGTETIIHEVEVAVEGQDVSLRLFTKGEM